jgi:hypothetical protein
MDWIKKHVDTVIVLGAVLSSVLWMNHEFNGIKRDILIIKTVLLMKNIMPQELIAHSQTLKTDDPHHSVAERISEDQAHHS